MATRMKMLKLLQEMRGLSDLSRLHAAPKAPALFLMEFRTRMAEAHRPKRRMIIPVQMADTYDFPDPVKITFLTAGESKDRV